MDEKIQYWISTSEYDIETAQAMLDAGRYLYVGFMCHQAVEKILKGYFQLVKNTMPPKTHNLLYLCTESGLSLQMNEEQFDIIDELDPLNIQSRYPESAESLKTYYKKDESDAVLKKTEELHKWIKQKLS